MFDLQEEIEEGPANIEVDDEVANFTSWPFSSAASASHQISHHDQDGVSSASFEDGSEYEDDEDAGEDDEDNEDAGGRQKSSKSVVSSQSFKTPAGKDRVVKKSSRDPECAPLIGLLSSLGVKHRMLHRIFKRRIPPPPRFVDPRKPTPKRHSKKQLASMFNRYKKKYLRGVSTGARSPFFGGEIDIQVRNLMYEMLRKNPAQKFNHKKISDMVMERINASPHRDAIRAKAKKNLDNNQLSTSCTFRMMQRHRLPTRLATTDNNLLHGYSMSAEEREAFLSMMEDRHPVSL